MVSSSLSSSSSLPSLPSLSSKAHNHRALLRQRQRSILAQCDHIQTMLAAKEGPGATESVPSLGRQTSQRMPSLCLPGAQPAGLSPMLAASPGAPMPFSTTDTPGLTQAHGFPMVSSTSTRYASAVALHASQGDRDESDAWRSPSGPWRHYLFRNFTPPQRRQDPPPSWPRHNGSRTFNPLRKVTPMRWGPPGTYLSEVTPEARALARQRRNAEAILGERLPALGNSLLTCPQHPILNQPPL